MTRIVRALPSVSTALRNRIAESPRTADAHAGFMNEMPAMGVLEVEGDVSGVLPTDFTATAWNVERCLFADASARFLSTMRPAIVLLSEMDHGMARTAQRHTTAEIAKTLGMAYAYGIEFFEMSLGGPTEREFAKDHINAEGFHGNAVLSSVPFERLKLIRLPEPAYWFAPGGMANAHEPRIGSRMAIAAILPTEAGQICVVSTHLESNAFEDYRARQMLVLMDEIDAFAPGLPVLIGGDLNTGNRMAPDWDWRRESLFDLARARGYDWSASPEGITTRASLITRHPDRQMRLDWFAMRGITGHPHPLILPETPDGTPLSDHFCITANFSL